jgi:uncharacterized protein YjiS (DUF1127 family)
MTTQKNLQLEQLPYGYEAGLVTDLMAVPGKVIAGIGRLIETLGEAIEMRNRYLELDGLNDAALKQLGIKREAIPQVVALEAGLFGHVNETPVAHNNNDRDVRPAA